GQKQRVAIARALAGKPKVLLSDEATSALDPDATDSILDLLARLNKQLGLTIVLITHEMSVIKAICNKVAVLEEGKIVEEGDAYEVFADPQAPITRKFIRSASALGKLETLVRRGQISTEDGRLIVLTFSRDSVGDALISAISRDYGLAVNIALANIDMLHDGALGRLACVIKGEPERIESALAYLRENKVGVEEVKYA
ncbi:MAG: ATP-binding cassette domain-containing protein, partial [Lachnospiraceae bacterium]|nr:ATP-binding cassette domain-containing protein [Lachnospiraceae bacterium]